MASGQRYPGRVVIVTGGTSGIGEGIVREFGEIRDMGVGNGKRSGGSGEGCFVVCDVLCETDMKISVESMLNKCSTLAYFLIFALPYLRKTKGNIINVASIVAHFGQKLAVPYVATKGAVIAMTKAMAIDESQYGVRVNSISPSNIWTPGWEKLASQAANAEAMIKEGKDAQLMGRMGTPAECAKAALYLASDATFCTGTNLFLGGGAELGYGRKSHQDPNSGFDS
uniref:Hydroxysteroid 17-beta dehydrogenase 14 n=1 Tax=Naja naja TaxID=35670 RepID=A0A8C6XSE5_NAJNA